MKMRVASALAAICLSAIFSVSASAQTSAKSIDKEKEADIKKLITITGGDKLSKQIMNQLLDSFTTSLPQVPAKFWENFRNEVKTDDLVDLIIPVYDKHLSHDDIKELIKFYETPAGQRVLQALPNIARDSLIVGQEYGKRISEKAIQKLREQGY